MTPLAATRGRADWLQPAGQFGILQGMPAAFIYQILTPLVSPRDLDPGFLVLDNSRNARPDWFEYWPIRNFLLEKSLDEEAFYGFLSPKFKQKTNLGAAAVHAIAREADAAIDVILLSPSIHNSSYHLNVFAHGDSEHPGLLEISKRFFERIGRSTNLDEVVNDSRNTVTSNYFVAKPRFWREWFVIAEALFAIAEAPADPLGAELRGPTAYRGAVDVQMKVFIVERIASWLLAVDRSFRTRVPDPFAARARIYKLPVAIVCDALKMAYATEGRAQYKEVFLMVSGLRNGLNARIRIGSLLRSRRFRPFLDALAAYWNRAGR